MTARGCLFAVTAEDVDALLAAAGDDEAVIDYVVEVIEERWEDGYVGEVDKAWDAIHRVVGDGTLEPDTGPYPLNQAIFGGRLLTSGDEFVFLTSAASVPDVSAALEVVTRGEFEAAYNRIDSDDYGSEHGPEDLEYSWEWFQNVRHLWRQAASANRAVIFSVAQ